MEVRIIGKDDIENLNYLAEEVLPKTLRLQRYLGDLSVKKMRFLIP